MFLQKNFNCVLDAEITRIKTKEIRFGGKINPCKPSRLIITPQSQPIVGSTNEKHESKLLK